jgi:hypothetical protein
MRKKRKTLNNKVNYLLFNFKKVDSDKISILMLIIDEILSNALRNLMSEEKIVKIKEKKSIVRKVTY